MKLIKKYIFAFVITLMAFFVVKSNCALAAGENDSLIADVDDEYAVINPSSTNEPNNKYDNVQYTKARDIKIKLKINQTELDKYDEKFEICEVIPQGNMDNTREMEKCSTYLTSADEYNFQLKGRNDGEKTLKIYFYDNYQVKVATKTITKNIVLDTTGPSIVLNEGAYVFLTKGQKYKEPGATCNDDSGVLVGECVVDIQDVDINMNSKDYQYIRYTAKDFLGNEVNALRVIMVEIPEEKENNKFWIFAGVGIAILAGFLFVHVLKNKEKQKNQSIL